MYRFSSAYKLGCAAVMFLLAAFMCLSTNYGYSQATIATGSIQGTITDPQGAVVPGAKVTITSAATGQTLVFNTTSSGAYSAGALIPGEYKVRVEAKGFQASELPVNIQVGVVSSGNIKLQVGQESQTVTVEANAVAVNTEQATVQGVLTAQQIDNLPVNGRNFLDLAQLEPGVQIQDGTNFDPTKVGYSSISFGGRFGRTARIEVDGLDVSDETVGTTTEDIPASAIQEFQISQSSLDLSNELTSSGAVNVATRSGSNDWHGEAFYLFRDSSTAAALPAPPGLSSPFQRNQVGGRLGGPIVKDKLFFFIDGEHTLQHLQAPVSLAGTPFSAFSGTFPAPFKEAEDLARADYQLTKSARLFYRFSYFDNSTFATFFPSSFQIYNNKDYTRNHVVGADFTTGSFTHSLRYSYLKFQNGIVDAAKGSSLPFASFPVSLNIGPLATGPNLLAPQATPQSDNQVKYDGSKPWGNHIIRFGISVNHIQGGGFASFFKITPQMFDGFGSTETSFAATGPFPGGASNPLNYPVETITVGNGQGFSTEHPAFGFPAGGLGPDNRLGIYLGDSWRMLPNLTWTYGLRYVRDTGRTDSDLPAIPALNALFPGLGDPIRQANLNLAPQLGVAWDPWKDGKTSVRAGIGIFYENVIYNNVLFDRPAKLASGAFLSTPSPCSGSVPQPVPTSSGTIIPGAGGIPNFCGLPIGSVAGEIAAFQTLYQSLSPFSLTNPNPNYIVTLLSKGLSPPAGSLFAPDYTTPRSLQINVGVQRQLWPGSVISADYLRNVDTHFTLGVDINHTGDVRFFNKAAAVGAISRTNSAMGCGAGTDAASINCAIAAGATMATYAGNGLTSSADFGGSCPTQTVLAPGGPFQCAFPGINPTSPVLNFLYPVGRSVYNGLQVKWTQNVNHPVPGFKSANFQFAYALSRFVNPGGLQSPSAGTGPGTADQDFVLAAADNANPLRYEGPALLDRTNQFSFGGFADLPWGFRAGIISHFYSPLPANLTVQNTGAGAGEIFRTDFTGDGTVDDPLPGTTVGNFGRGISASNLNSVIANYNSIQGNMPTPAGQTLITAGLFTLAQLQALGGVAPMLSPAPAGQVNMDWLRALDFKLAWRYTIHERFTVEPSVGLYNMFNFANFDLPPGVLSGFLNGSPGSVNGTTYNQQSTVRVGAGTGVFGLGSPRVVEFGLRLTF